MSEIDAMKAIEEAIESIHSVQQTTTRGSRELSEALTHVETARLWLKEHARKITPTFPIVGGS